MRASRLLSIMLLLQARGRATASALADELEVSVRTIYRDMDDLSTAGVPIFADRGTTGGYQLLDGFRTQLTGLTPDEAGALFLLGLPKAAADLGLREAMTTARRKIDAALPDARRRVASIVASRFHLDTTGWFKPVEHAEILPSLAGAVWEERKITVRYRSWKGESKQELAPLGIVLKAGVWYVVALGRRHIPATYRVSAIKDLEVLDVTFKRPMDFDLDTYWTTASRELATRLQQGTATLRVTQRGFEMVGKLGVEVAEAAEKTRGPVDTQGWSVIEVPVERTENAVADILSLSIDAVLLGPPTLLAAVRAAVGHLVDLYSKGP